MTDIDQNHDYDYLVKILALGDSLVGKSSFIHRYTDNTFLDDATSTIGIDLREKRLVYHDNRDLNDNIYRGTENVKHSQVGKPTTVGKRIRLLIYDTAGQERYRSIATSFFRDAMGFFVVFDVTKESSFTNVRSWLTHLEVHANCSNPPIVLLGNKSDLADKAREVDAMAITDLAEQVGVPYLEVSALSGENVEVAVGMLLDMVMDEMEKRRKADDDDACSVYGASNGDTVKLKSGQPKLNKCACC